MGWSELLFFSATRRRIKECLFELGTTDSRTAIATATPPAVVAAQFCQGFTGACTTRASTSAVFRHSFCNIVQLQATAAVPNEVSCRFLEATHVTRTNPKFLEEKK